MAEWLYDIRQVNTVTDAELVELLRERGVEGWELVQLIPASASTDQHGYRLIFKSQKPQVAASSGA